MNEVVDKNVVKMEFNNKKFNSKIESSSTLLDKFKEKLNFKKESKSAQELDENINKLSFARIARETAKAVPGMTILLNLTNRLVDSAINLGKSLTIAPVLQGFQKYENEITSVQTIMNATGKSIDVVSEALDELTWYADETSYSLTTMSDSVGKFTAAGVDLDDAVTAVEGIANWAALSGQNAEKASRAMYNLSQAIGSGKLGAIDWRSIELANMGTEEFKQTVMETAKELGVLNAQFKTKNGFQVSVNNFRDSLSKGWVTNEVLVASLKKYASYSKEVYEIATRDGISAQEAMDKLGRSTSELGVKAFKAAQESKTFTDAINAARDAVSSGWKKTFELIFGNYEEAKELWSGFAEELWNIFAQPASFRNELLEQWKELGGREKLLEGVSTIYNKIADAVRQVKDAFREVIPPLTVQNLINVTNKFFEFAKNLKISEGALATVKSLAKSLGYILKAVGTVLSAIFSVLPGIIHLLDPLISAVSVVAQAIEGLLSLIVGEKDGFSLFGFAVNALAFIFESVAAAANVLTSALVYLFDQLRESELVKSVAEFFKDIKTNVKKIVSIVGSALTNLFNKIKNSKALEYLVGFFGFIVAAIVQGITSIGTAIGNFIKKVGESKLVQSTIAFFIGIGQTIGDIFKDIGSFAETAGDSVSEFFTTIGDRIKEGWGVLKGFFTPVIGTIAGLFGQLFEWIKGLGIWKTIKDMDFVKLAKAILDIAIAVKLLASAWNGIKISSSVNKLIKSFSTRNYSEAIRNLAISFGIFAVSLAALSLVDANNLKNVASVLETLLIIIGSFATVLAVIATIASRGGKTNAITEFVEQINPLTNLKESLRIRGIGLVLIGISVLIATFARSVERLAAIEDSGKMLKAAAAVLGALALIDAFVYVAGKLNEMPKAGKGILKKVITMVGFFLGISATFGGLSVLIVKIAEWTKDADKLLEVGAAVGAAALGFGALAAAFSKLYDSIAKSEAYSIDKKTIFRFMAALSAFALMMASIGISLNLVNRSYTDSKSLWMSAAVIIAMTAGLVAISFALAGLYDVIARIDWREQNYKAFETFALIFGGLAVVMASIGASINLLAKAALNPKAFWTAAGVLGGFLVALGVVAGLLQPYWNGSIKIANGSASIKDTLIKIAIVMATLAGALGLISGAIALVAKVSDDPDKIAAAGGMLALNIAMLSLFTAVVAKSLKKLPSNSKLKVSNLVSASIFMAAATASILGIAYALKMLLDAGLGKPGWGWSVAILGGSMIALGLFVKALSKIKTNTLPQAGAFVAIAAGITMIGFIISQFKELDLNELNLKNITRIAGLVLAVGAAISGISALVVLISKIKNINQKALLTVAGVFGIIGIALAGLTTAVALFASSIKTFVDSIGDLSKNVESAKGALPALADEMVKFANTIVANKDLMNEAISLVSQVLPAMALLETVDKLQTGAAISSVAGTAIITAGIVGWVMSLKNMSLGQMIAVLPILAVASKILIAIGLLVASMWLIKDVKWYTVLEVFMGAAGMIAMLVVLFHELSKIKEGAFGKGIAIATMISAIGAFIGELATLMIILKDANIGSILAGLGGVVLVIGALAAIMFAAQKLGIRKAISTILMLTALGASIWGLTLIVDKLNDINASSLVTTLLGIAGALSVITWFFNKDITIGDIGKISLLLAAIAGAFFIISKGFADIKGGTETDGWNFIGLILGLVGAVAALAALGPLMAAGWEGILIGLATMLALAGIMDLAALSFKIISNSIGSAVKNLDILKEELDGINKTISDAVNAIYISTPKLVSALRSLGKEAGTAMSYIGEQIMQGFTIGLLSASQLTFATIQEIIDKIKHEFTNDQTGFGVHSPSKWFEQLGINLGKGFDLGFSKKNPVADVADKVVSGIKTAFNVVKDTGVQNAVTGIEKAFGDPIDGIKGKVVELGKALGILDEEGKFNITAVVNMDEYDKFAKSISRGATMTLDSSIARLPREQGYYLDLPSAGTTTATEGQIVFNQNNYSPKALSETEIFNQTRNLVSYTAYNLDRKAGRKV